MRLMATMTRTALLAAASGLILLALAEADGVSAQSPGARRGLDAALSAYAQVRPKLRRPRARIRVTPAYRYPYRLNSSIYPIPYEYEYPGPGAVRQCASALVTEYRPSGPVIVPRMRCWWER
jgi:hypothetical protein